MTPAKILLVEDERLVALSMQRKLESMGYQVPHTVATGEEAIEQTRRLHPDLILMDIMLAGEMDGITAAGLIRQQYNVPLIYLTAYSDEDTLQRARVTEPFGYLLKPFEGKELHTAIEMALYKHRMERKLQEKEQWLSTILNSIGDAVIVTNQQAQITFMNPVAEALTGWSLAEAHQQNVYEVFHLVDEVTGQPQTNLVETVMAASQVWQGGNLVLVRRNGEKRPIEKNVAPIQDENGRISGAVLTFRDVSEKRQAEKSLRASEEKYRLLFNTSPESITVVGLDGLILDCNEATARLRQRPKNEIIGQPFTEVELLKAEDLPQYMALFTQLLQGEPVNPITVELQDDAQQSQWIESFPTLLRQEGQPTAIQVISRDITERKTAENELHHYQENLEALVECRTAALETLNAQLQQEAKERERAQELMARQAQHLARSNAELEQFAYIASHDLREPLRKVQSYTELLVKRYGGQLDERADKYIFYIVDGTTRMQQLITDLLTYSRLGRAEFELKETDVTGVLHKTLQDLEVAIRETNASVTWDTLPTMAVDGSQINRLFQNLIGNALKFCQADPPQIHISAQRQGHEWHFTITDNGIGIDSQYLERIFLIFQRLHTRSEYPGTGMGLAICKKIVENHNGRIWATSQLGQGTTFHFTLPAVTIPAPSHKTATKQ